MDEYIIHLPEFRVIVCKKCQYAVLPSQIDTHFAPKKLHPSKKATKKPHGLNKVTRDRIKEEVAKIDGLISNPEALKQCQFPFPPSTAGPIPALAQPKTNGKRCTFKVGETECGYICCSLQQIREHCGLVHQWKSQEKGGGRRRDVPRRVPNVPWQAGIHCQRFFPQGTKSQYFEVRFVEPGPPPTPRLASRKSQFEAAKQEMQRAFEKAEEEEKRRIEETDEAKEPSPWLKRTGWITHLTSVDRKEVRELVEPVNEEDEPHMAILCTAFEALIQDAQWHAVREVVGQQALFEANKKEVHKEPNMPFDSWMDITTIERYVGVWKQLLLYVFRAEEDEPEFRPPYVLTDRQQIAMKAVSDKIMAFQEWKREIEKREEEEVENQEGDEGFEEDEEEIDGEDRIRRQEEEEVEAREDEGFEDEDSEEVKWIREIQREVLRVCIALLDQPLQDNEYESAIISGLAVLGIKDDKAWFDAEDYTPKYSAVIKLARLMVVQDAYEQRQDQIHRYQSQDIPETVARKQARSYYNRVKQSVSRFMTMAHDGRDPTPMQWIYQTRSYGFKIRYTTPAAGKIQWIREELLYPGTRLQMSQLRSMVHGLIGEARDELFGKLMMVDTMPEGGETSTTVPVIDWENIVDQPSETKVGWSFLDDDRNKFGTHKEWWLFERLYQEQALREQFLDTEGRLKEGAGETYQRHIERFQELLLILMHLCGGQPSRAPEILGLRWKNTANGGVRNIVIEDGLVAFVAQYHKGYRSSGNIKIIHRYLPKEVGELLVYYLWLVLPFWEKLQCQMTGKVVSSAFIWGDAEKREHRQWAGPKRGREKGVRGKKDSRGEEGGHTGRRRPSWTSERVRKIMQEASIRWMGSQSSLSISAWRQIAIAISRRFCRENRFEDESGKWEAEEGWDEDNAAGDDPWDLQAGHGTHIAGMIYARELMEGSNTIIGRREKFRQVSSAWHRFLEFASTRHDHTDRGVKRKRPSFEEEMDDVQARRWKKLRMVDAQEALEDMFGAGTQFRGLQKPALEAIMKHESPVLVVMGTGVGKTMLFQIPAKSVSSGTTIVITPLVSLQDHMVERCRQVGISCTKWDSQQAAEMRAQVVIVTPESAVSKAFGMFLNALQGRRELVRIVFDECHTVMDSTPDFRPQMQQLGGLATREVQMVFLTATLPPHMEREFMRIMKIQPDEVRRFRGPTTRPNIAYSVHEYPTDVDETDAVHQLVQEKLEQYRTPAKIIIYGGTIERTKELSQTLGCHQYYREAGDRDEKAEIMGRWQRADGRLVVATNAFGLGIDAPDVRVVIHAGTIYQMRSYSQESGRGGRDGRRSEAIIVMPAGKQEAFQKTQARAQAHKRPWKIQSRIMSQPEVKRAEWEKVERFLSGSKCRRIFLDAEMDGRHDRLRCDVGEERCDVCEKDDATIEAMEAQRQVYVQGGRERQDRWIDSGIDNPSSSNRLSGFEGNIIESSMPLPLHQSPPDGSPSSIASFDQGFATERITHTDQFEFQSQQGQRAQQRLRVEAEIQQESQEVWDLEDRLDRWVGKCPVCYVRKCAGQQVDMQHAFDVCPDPKQRFVARQVEILKEIRFDAFACCTTCAVPQRVCTHWQEVAEGHERFQEDAAMPCQYRDVVRPAVAAMLVVGPGIREELVRWMNEEVIVGEEGYNEEGVKQVRRVMLEWFGTKVTWGSIEASVFIQVFYRFARHLEEAR